MFSYIDRQTKNLVNKFLGNTLNRENFSRREISWCSWTVLGSANQPKLNTIKFPVNRLMETYYITYPSFAHI